MLLDGGKADSTVVGLDCESSRRLAKRRVCVAFATFEAGAWGTRLLALHPLWIRANSRMARTTQYGLSNRVRAVRMYVVDGSGWGLLAGCLQVGADCCERKTCSSNGSNSASVPPFGFRPGNRDFMIHYIGG